MSAEKWLGTKHRIALRLCLAFITIIVCAFGATDVYAHAVVKDATYTS